MPIPVVQAGAKQVWLFSSLPKTVTLSGSASNTPILEWRWVMQYTPPGSTAASGTNLDFIDGVAAVQNPSFICDVPGCFVLQLQARNVDGWNELTLDRELAQTPVYILTEKLSLRLPGAFLWKYDVDLNQTLTDIETAINTSSVDITALHKASGGEIYTMSAKSVPIADDLLVVEDSADSYGKKKVRVGDLPPSVDTTALHKAVAGEISALTEKSVPANADVLVMEDSGAAYSKKKVQVGSLDAAPLRVVEIAQEGSSPYVVNLTTADSGKVYTTESASIEISLNLPEAAAGLHFTFIEKSLTTRMKVYAQSGDTIRMGGVLSDTTPHSIWPFDDGGGEGDVRGLVAHLVAINGTEWVVVSYVGIWELVSGS